MRLRHNPFPGIAVYDTSFFDFSLGDDIFALSDDDWSDVLAIPVGETGVSSRLVSLTPILDNGDYFQRNLCNRIIDANELLEDALRLYIPTYGYAVEADTGIDLIEWDGVGESTPVTASMPIAQLHVLTNINNGSIALNFHELSVDVILRSGETLVSPAQFPFSVCLVSLEADTKHFLIHKYLR